MKPDTYSVTIVWSDEDQAFVTEVNRYAQALERRCFSKDTSGGNWKPVLLITLEDQSKG
jgi:hypothetical protein